MAGATNIGFPILYVVLGFLNSTRTSAADMRHPCLENGTGMMKADSIDIYTECFGDSTKPAVLLIMGASASMI